MRTPHATSGHSLLQQGQMLGRQFGLQGLDSGDVAPRSDQAARKAKFNQISRVERDDWDGGRNLTHTDSLSGPPDNEDIDARWNQLGDEIRDPVILIRIRALLDNEVPSFDPAQLA